MGLNYDKEIIDILERYKKVKKEIVRNSVLGLILGDALGVPVEFKGRHELDRNPVRDMIGYGTNNKPLGTWSDDSSMALITLESLIKGYDLEDIMKGFCKWLLDGYMTPYGKTFSIGKTTSTACRKYSINKDIEKMRGNFGALKRQWFSNENTADFNLFC